MADVKAAAKFYDRQYEKRPENEPFSDNVREAALLTFKEFRLSKPDAQALFRRIVKATIPSYVDKAKTSFQDAWKIYQAGSSTKSKGTTRRPGRSAKKEPRIKWRYFPFPIAIWDDPSLPANAKLAAGKIARSINLGPWNTDLHADLSYAAFGIGSVRTAQRAVDALKGAEYIETESLNRGGVRYWFTDKASGT
jgi:hypothetical protein